MEEIDCEGLTLHSDTGELISNQILKLVVATEQRVETAGQSAVLIVIPWFLATVPARVAIWKEATQEVVSVVTVECSIYDPDKRLTSIEGTQLSQRRPQPE